MAPRRLFGWEPRTVTEYVYEEGVLVGEVSYLEPEYDAGQVALLLAWERLQANKTPHGIPFEEATDAANQFAFDVDGPTVDWAANTLAVRQDAFYKAYPDTNRAGHLWTVKRRSPSKQKPNLPNVDGASN